MVQRDSELVGYQSNLNDIGKCHNCGMVLKTKQEKEMQLCQDCQERHKDVEEI
ncbi:hypothetical protein NC661_10605 [Aquibacillus koreensis]|uniref:Uncharacterized protein n=1 Tax=Aquibacillus koreensis TaxID=279446 RepID=A0A9X4AIK0_9BACI|nr:hypothetical protein [Aquibacillus koreensis]MCT2538237.1 hypothetical protein [Aquibacillus koreensis]MDC3420819.1 hypothetical protein [Aquibacillus koreensis]